MNIDNYKNTEERIKEIFKSVEIQESNHRKSLENELESRYNRRSSSIIFKYSIAFASVVVLVISGVFFFNLPQNGNKGGNDQVKNPNNTPTVKTFEQRVAGIIDTPETPKIFLGVPLDIVTTNVLQEEYNTCYETCNTSEKLNKAIEIMKNLSSYKTTVTDSDNAIYNILSSEKERWKRSVKTNADGSKEEVLANSTTVYIREYSVESKSWSMWDIKEIPTGEYNVLYIYSPEYILNELPDNLVEKFKDETSLLIEISFTRDNSDYKVIITPSLTIQSIQIKNGEDVTDITYSNYEKPFGLMHPKVMTSNFTASTDVFLANVVKFLKNLNSGLDSYTVVYKNTDVQGPNLIEGTRNGEGAIYGNNVSNGEYWINTGGKRSNAMIIGTDLYTREIQNGNWSNWKKETTNGYDTQGTSRKEILSFMIKPENIKNIKEIKISESYSDLLKNISFTYAEGAIKYQVSLDVNGYYEVKALSVKIFDQDEYVNTIYSSYGNYDHTFKVVSPMVNSSSQFTYRCAGANESPFMIMAFNKPASMSALDIQEGEDNCMLAIRMNGYSMIIKRKNENPSVIVGQNAQNTVFIDDNNKMAYVREKNTITYGTMGAIAYESGILDTVYDNWSMVLQIPEDESEADIAFNEKLFREVVKSFSFSREQ